MHRSEKGSRRVAATVDLTTGPLFKRIILYTLPIILTGILQLLFNTADLVVVGHSTNPAALDAVGSTGSLINLIVNVLIGLSVGAGVMAARYFGSRDETKLSELIHTAIPTAAIGGVLFGAVGCAFGDKFLQWMDTPPEVIEEATLYVRIYCAGIPFSILYNFGASILRSVGDTTRPLIFLVIAGVVNVCFNLLFVFAFKMDVDGVATATVISQVLSCALVLGYMMKIKEPHRLELKKMRLRKEPFLRILAIGLPAGVQGSLFSVSNIIIQRAINGFGSSLLGGNAAASNLEGYVYTSMNAFHQTALTFTGQHLGAKKYARLKKIIGLCLICVSVVGVILGVGVFLLGKPLLGIYSPNENVVTYGLIRLQFIALPYFLCGVMDVLGGVLRGMGYSFSSMLITLTCVCGYRIIWVYTYFAQAAHHTYYGLLLSYPISWAVCSVLQGALLIFAFIRLNKKAKKEAGSDLEAPMSEGLPSKTPQEDDPAA